MKNLSHKLTLAEEHERKRIATTLHAEVGQTLAFLKLKISELKGKKYPKNIKEDLEELHNLAENAINSTRSLMTQLSPAVLYELGFIPAVDWLAEHILRENNIKYSFKDDGKEKPLTDDLSILLFQAVRELLVNIRKHAKAKNVKIYIKRQGENIQIEVKDNGIGFDTSALDSYLESDVGFGLLNIRSRIDVVGGYFEIEKTPGPPGSMIHHASRFLCVHWEKFVLPGLLPAIGPRNRYPEKVCLRPGLPQQTPFLPAAKSFPARPRYAANLPSPSTSRRNLKGVVLRYCKHRFG